MTRPNPPESPTDSPPEPKRIQQLTTAVYPSFAMLAGMQLDLFTPLKNGPMSTEQLASAIGVNVAKLQPLLYALVVAGLLYVEDNRFSNTNEANHFLVRGEPSYMGDEHSLYADFWGAMLKTGESIKKGVPQAKHDYAQMTQAELESFLRGLHPDALQTGWDLAEKFDFSTHRRLLDVGGGSAGLSIAITEACPNLRATVIDLPTVTPITKRFVAEANAEERVDIVTIDIVHKPSKGSFDVAVLKAFIQVLSPDDAQAALRNIGAVIKPGGRIYILGNGILDNSRLSPPDVVVFNLVFLNVYGSGQAYTEQEYKDWLKCAGFTGFERIITPDSGSILTAKKT